MLALVVFLEMAMLQCGVEVLKLTKRGLVQICGCSQATEIALLSLENLPLERVFGLGCCCFWVILESRCRSNWSQCRENRLSSSRSFKLVRVLCLLCTTSECSLDCELEYVRLTFPTTLPCGALVTSPLLRYLASLLRASFLTYLGRGFSFLRHLRLVGEAKRTEIRDSCIQRYRRLQIVLWTCNA